MGYRIKELREERGMSQMELARRAGVTRATLWRLESGVGKDASTKTLMKIANALSVEVRELFFDPTA